MIALKEAEYVLSEGDFRISMTVNFKNRTFTMQTKTGKCDFLFLDTEPAAVFPVLRLLREATDLANQLLEEHAGKEDSRGLDKN
jgi:hypothetical protein